MTLRASIAIGLCAVACRPHTASNSLVQGEPRRLPTGRMIDPAGVVRPVGQMPLGAVASPDGQRMLLLLGGWREQGLQVVDHSGTIRQTLPQAAAFVGLVFSRDGHSVYASGGNTDVVYRYRWEGDSAALTDSIVLAHREPRQDGTRYPAGLALSPDGTRLYVAENLADSIAVVDLQAGTVVQRLATGPFPYAIAVGGDGAVFVSNWGSNALSVFNGAAGGRLTAAAPIAAGRHPSALLLDSKTGRLFVASGSTDRVAIVDTKSRQVVATLRDSVPAGPDEGTTPNALALSRNGDQLFVAEADANAVAVFALTPAGGTLAGRMPAGWYPTAVLALGTPESLFIANGKGDGTGPNPDGPQPGVARPQRGPTGPDMNYTLGQIKGSLSMLPVPPTADLPALSARVARANGWDAAVASRMSYPPFQHVIYIIKENRTYDQVLGDLSQADGDTSLVLFGRPVSPNHHALAERFGIFDRFFVNAEVSADGHNWSTAAYATDYTQKTTPSNYSDRGRSYDYEGTNRNEVVTDDAAEPAQGYLWDLAQRAGISLANFGEFSVEERGADSVVHYRGTKPFLAAHTDPNYPIFDMTIPDQHRIDVWLARLRQWVAANDMPTLQIMHLPCDHTAGANAGMRTPRAMVADNDLALGRLVEAVSRSPFWKSTVIFVLEDDAQNGPDHVDSHRSPLLVISAYNRFRISHRFTNTTDVLRTIEGILRLGNLSQFDHFGHPLDDIWSDTPDTTAFTALTPGVALDERNPAQGRAARDSKRLDLTTVDAADMELFNHVIWMAVKGERSPYPGTHRMSALELRRSH